MMNYLQNRNEASKAVCELCRKIDFNICKNAQNQFSNSNDKNNIKRKIKYANVVFVCFVFLIFAFLLC